MNEPKKSIKEYLREIRAINDRIQGRKPGLFGDAFNDMDLEELFKGFKK